MKVIYNPQKARSLGYEASYRSWAGAAQLDLSKPFEVLRVEESFGENCYVVKRDNAGMSSHVGMNVFDIWLEKPINLDDYL